MILGSLIAIISGILCMYLDIKKKIHPSACWAVGILAGFFYGFFVCFELSGG